MKYYYLDNKNALNGKYGEISNGLLEEKKSKFYSYVFHIDNELDAIEKINNIKRDNRDARHVVYIYSYLENNMPSIKNYQYFSSNSKIFWRHFTWCGSFVSCLS